MENYQVRIWWDVSATMEIAAESLAEAEKKAQEFEFPLPKEGFVEGPYIVDIITSREWEAPEDRK